MLHFPPCRSDFRSNCRSPYHIQMHHLRARGHAPPTFCLCAIDLQEWLYSLLPYLMWRTVLLRIRFCSMGQKIPSRSSSVKTEVSSSCKGVQRQGVQGVPQCQRPRLLSFFFCLSQHVASFLWFKMASWVPSIIANFNQKKIRRGRKDHNPLLLRTLTIKSLSPGLLTSHWPELSHMGTPSWLGRIAFI